MPNSPLDAPVTVIEGIGPAVAQRLAQMAVYTVKDMLRARGEELHAAVASIASLEQARRWRTMAAFLQVEGMSNQWAEALAAAGFTSLDALHRASAQALREAFDAASASGTISGAPADAALAAMRVDVAVLSHTGAVNVTVRDDAGAPVGGAILRAGSLRAETDARGRARIPRIPLGRPALLTVETVGFTPAVLELRHLLVDELQTGVESVQLTRVVAGASAPSALSEYDGDLLPAFAEHAVTSETRPGPLRERDVLMLRRFDEDGTAQMTSKFLEYRAGTFVAVSFRVERSLLPEGVQLRQHFLVRGDQLQRVAMNATRLDFFKAMRRARAAMAGRPPAQTIAERDARMHEYAVLVAANRVWAPRGTGGGA